MTGVGALATGEAIDLVVGPGGAVLVLVADHRGERVWASGRDVRADGVPHPYVRGVEHELGRLEAALRASTGRPVRLSALVAIRSPRELVVAAGQRDVRVIAETAIAETLRARSTELDTATIDALAAAASSLAAVLAAEHGARPPAADVVSVRSGTAPIGPDAGPSARALDDRGAPRRASRVLALTAAIGLAGLAVTVAALIAGAR
ncbi:hypothetical protein QT381_06225 [Galbitalea sp. SE-J8]|uniref:hypothetical protein n=1 Tax=Galbitalea sp. SE-J8 TaxID=3054952 RepID=UPI00259CD99F|nr:hypothetical protein [Galbitalea sp. SE-J8]MDM4762598.1 hypothetical protein [Galbitalea sp. SE-J8]